MESKNARANHGAPFSLKSFPIDLAGWKVDSGKQTDTNSIYSKSPWWHSVSQAPSCHPQDRGEPVVNFQGAAKGSYGCLHMPPEKMGSQRAMNWVSQPDGCQTLVDDALNQILDDQLEIF